MTTAKLPTKAQVEAVRREENESDTPDFILARFLLRASMFRREAGAILAAPIVELTPEERATWGGVPGVWCGCEMCQAPGTDRHHRDDDTGNNAPENLAILCRRCHMNIDGRLEAFALAGPKANPPRPPKQCSNCERLSEALAAWSLSRL